MGGASFFSSEEAGNLSDLEVNASFSFSSGFFGFLGAEKDQRVQGSGVQYGREMKEERRVKEKGEVEERELKSIERIARIR